MAATAAVAAFAVAMPLTSAESVGAVVAQPWTISATPVASLTDGQSVAITLKTTRPDLPIYSAEAHVCRSGVAWQPSPGPRPADDFKLAGDNCPLTPISSSADASVTDNNIAGASSDLGETFALRVGTGLVAWTSTASGLPASLTCDSTHPCTLVVEVRAGNPATWTPWAQELTYQVDDPVAGCGGPAAGSLASGASDRMTDPWVTWTLDECRRPGHQGAATTASFLGEGQALDAYSRGKMDLVYSAAGYNKAVGLTTTDPLAPVLPRASVYVPVAVNATVLAVGNGRPGPNGHKIPYNPPKLTLEEAAAILTGGQFGPSPAQTAAFRARNPEFASTTLFVQQSGTLPVQAPSEAEATSWYGTNYLTRLIPAAWKVPDLPLFGTDAGRPRGADANLALAAPSFGQALGLYSGRPSLRKTLTGIGGFDYGGFFALTDLETATALGMTPVAIQNASGQFVAPTPASIRAAVDTLRPDANGMLQPDPTASAPAGHVQPYPLTFVEYAIAPAAPLVNASGCTRDLSQALLESWLTYITGDGQAKLPAGLAALPPDLVRAASVAIVRVGRSGPTPTCAEPSGTNTAPRPIVGGASGFAGGIAGFTYPNGSATAGAATQTPVGATPGASLLSVKAMPAPMFGGRDLPSGLVGVAALATTVLFVIGAAAFTGRGPGMFGGGGFL